MNDATVLPLPFHSGEQIPTREERAWVTSQELLEDAGISYRQLDYWTRTGLLTPIDGATPGSGYLRRYREDQVIKARGIRALLDAGVSLQTIRDVIDEVLAAGHVDIGPVTITHHPEETG